MCSYLALCRRILTQNQQAGEQVRVSPHFLCTAWSWAGKGKIQNPKSCGHCGPVHMGEWCAYIYSMSSERREDRTVCVRLPVWMDVLCVPVCVCLCVCMCVRPVCTRALSSAHSCAPCHPLSSTDGRGLNTNTLRLCMCMVCTGQLIIMIIIIIII